LLRWVHTSVADSTVGIGLKNAGQYAALVFGKIHEWLRLQAELDGPTEISSRLMI